MTTLYALLALFILTWVLLYQRLSLSTWTVSSACLLVFISLAAQTPYLAWLIFIIAAIALNVRSIREQYITLPTFKAFRKIKPTLSKTEQEALDAGTTWWEGDLFRGKPDWNQLHHISVPRMSAEEQAFLDGPVETICTMVNDWEITHERGDLSPEVWQFLKNNGFFAMIIPKSYGGLEFSAYAHSEVLVKLSSVSNTLASTVAVPNSLGPAELLFHYGTEEQKNYYLPRLAKGEEIPCFALTGPEAGSDAGAIPDCGIVCKGEWEGEETLGMRLTWNKRYITLAPVATVLGLAFKLYDPDKLLGGTEDIGITCALIPTNTPGVQIGRRHFPVNIPFQNGPTQGKDVFVPIKWIIGGQSMAGQGWRMLVESLSVGRSISLPSSATGSAKLAALATGAYSRIRKQFRLPIGKMEGVEEALARIASNTYIMDAARTFTAGAVDLGEKPSVPSAIVKYHITNRGRQVVNDAMDVHGGKAIMMGPNNYLARAYQGVPVGITVEGANILTRSMIIYGQGAIRCHPFVLKELEAANETDFQTGLVKFDNAFMGHVGFVASNFFRTLWLGLSSSRLVISPFNDQTARHYQQLTRLSTILALLSDITMAIFGAELKRKEKISGRLGDILSQLFLSSAALKHFDDQGRHNDDLPLLQWSVEDSIYQAQEAIEDIIDNFPSKPLRYVLRIIVFPLGRFAKKPSDRLGHTISKLLISPSEARNRLGKGAFCSNKYDHALGLLEQTLKDTLIVEPLLKRLRDGTKLPDTTSLQMLIEKGLEAKLISKDEAELIERTENSRLEIINVDDFDPDELFPMTHPKGN